MTQRVVYAQFSTWVTPTVQVQRGEAWDPDDPVVRSHPDWFTEDPSEFVRRSDESVPKQSVEAEAAPVVEQATKAPGEKRATRRA